MPPKKCVTRSSHTNLQYKENVRALTCITAISERIIICKIKILLFSTTLSYHIFKGGGDIAPALGVSKESIT